MTDESGRERWERAYQQAKKRDADFSTLSGLAVEPVYGPPEGSEPADGIGHEMHNQLCQRGVEGAVGKRKTLGNPAMHADLREAVADRRDEGGGRIDCRNTAAA